MAPARLAKKPFWATDVLPRSPGGPAYCRQRREVCRMVRSRTPTVRTSTSRRCSVPCVGRRWPGLLRQPGPMCDRVTKAVEHAHQPESGSHRRLFQARTVVSVSEILDRIDRELPVAVAGELGRLRAENVRLLRLLDLTSGQAAPPGPAQAAFFEAPPGLVHDWSPAAAKVAFFGALFAARTDVYAVRYDNRRTGRSGWVPAVRGGWRKGVRASRTRLPAADRGRAGRAPEGRGPHRPVPAAGRRQVLVAGG